MIRYSLVLVFTAVVLSATNFAPPVPASSISVRDIKGGTLRPLDLKGRKAVCLLFIATDCPISNQYAPEFGRIAKEYGTRGVSFYVVYTDTGTKTDAAAKHWKDFGYPCPGLLDTKHSLVRAAGATVTPECALFDSRGALQYRGRIDDLYVDFGKPRFAATVHDLRRSLDALLAGRPVPVKLTKVIGCAISDSS